MKTDLDDNAVVIHTAVDMMNRILDMSKKDFTENIITQDLVQIKERKLLSKGRKSRREIVEVARNPDQNVFEGDQSQSFVKRMFTPRNRNIN